MGTIATPFTEIGFTKLLVTVLTRAAITTLSTIFITNVTNKRSIRTYSIT
jgi:hypothetical protein